MGAFLDSANEFLRGEMTKADFIQDLCDNIARASDEQLRRLAEAIQKDA